MNEIRVASMAFAAYLVSLANRTAKGHMATLLRANTILAENVALILMREAGEAAIDTTTVSGPSLEDRYTQALL